MESYIILLRGINVSGQKKIKMAELRGNITGAGFLDVQTYIQSGNILLKSESDEQTINKAIAELILKNYGYKVSVMVFSQKEFRDIIEANPFSKTDGIDITKLHVTLLQELPKPESVELISGFKDANNEFVIDGKTIYLHCPDGYGKVKINNTFFEKKLKTSATTRNWKTMNTLLEMCINL